MAAGKVSPIIRAIREAESGTSGEIRVHLSRRIIEREPYRRAMKLFHQFGMQKTLKRNAVLLYVNLRRRKFAIYADEGIHKAVGQKYWEQLRQALIEDLQSTHAENAIAIAVRTIGATLKRYFPEERAARKVNELPDEVTED